MMWISSFFINLLLTGILIMYVLCLNEILLYIFQAHVIKLVGYYQINHV